MTHTMGWFADAAKEAASGGRWIDLKSHLEAYIRFVRHMQAFERSFRSNAEVSGDWLFLIAAEVPREALSIACGRSEVQIAVRSSAYIGKLLDVLSEPPADGTGWATLVAAPVVTAAVTRESMVEAIDLAEHLALAVHSAICQWRNDDTRMRAYRYPHLGCCRMVSNHVDRF